MRKHFKPRVLVAVLAVVLATVVCASCSGGGLRLNYYDGLADDGSYNTDLFYRNDLLVNHAADPGALWVSEEEDPEYGGYYYMYPTGVYYNFQVFRSKDLNNWEKLGLAIDFETSKPWYNTNLWAPEVIRNPNDGLYYLYFSGGDSATINASTGGHDPYDIGVAVSDNPAGGFKMFTGENLYGETITEQTRSIDFNAEHGTPGEEYYMPARTGIDKIDIIDVSPFFDDNGDFYLYFRPCYSYGNPDSYPHLAVVKMRDMVTPDYTTYTDLTYPGFRSLEDKANKVSFDLETGSKLDEAPFMIKHGGLYYLTYAPFGYGGRTLYSVSVAISDSPFGPFVKISGQHGNPAVYVESGMDQMAGPGHHAFIKRGDEIFVIYHSLMNRETGDSNPRGIAVDRIQFIDGNNYGIKASDYGLTTESGTFDMIYCNGSTWSLQPLPYAVSGYTNVAKNATVTATNGSNDELKYLNDGIFANHEYTDHMQYSAKGKTEITLTFEKPTKIRAVMVYNGWDFNYAFASVDRIDFKLADKIQGQKTAYIKDIAFNPDYYDLFEMYVRPGCAVLAEFDEITVTELKISISKKLDAENSEGGDTIKISDVLVLGKEA